MRAFVGVPVPPEPALATLLEGLAALDADVKVVSPAQLHVTLSFLGDVPEDAALAPAIDEATRGVRGLTITLRGVGAFPTTRHPKVVWAGIQRPEAIAELASRVRDALSRAGWPGDNKEFRAHVTLARVKSHRGEAAVNSFVAEHANQELGEVSANVVRLYRSQLSREGPSYAVLHESPLEA